LGIDTSVAEDGSPPLAAQMVYCDHCDIGFHLACLTPALDDYPPDGQEWLCPDCSAAPKAARRRGPVPASMPALVDLVRSARRVVVVLGAGASVAAGIPDFRSAEGVYAITNGMALGAYQSKVEGQDLFDIEYFKHDPGAFFHFFWALSQVTSAAVPTMAHRFLAQLHARGKLQRIYTQNVDGLELTAGVAGDKVVACHGDPATSTCIACGLHCETAALEPLFAQRRVPYCDEVRQLLGIGASCRELQFRLRQQRGETARGKRRKVTTPDPTPIDPAILTHPLSKTEQAELTELDLEEGLMKPDIVFFGQGLPDTLDTFLQTDIRRTDLIIVCGTSMKVDPVALLPSLLSHDAPLVLINRESVKAKRCEGFDWECLGNADDICSWLMHELQWL
jgi:NAD-dependent histone deacetylase SIR2